MEDRTLLPSRREIATILEVNPNTVQKAFKLMEEEDKYKNEALQPHFYIVFISSS